MVRTRYGEHADHGRMYYVALPIKTDSSTRSSVPTTQNDTAMNKAQVTIRATVDAPVDKVWQYYTMPEHITGWNFASDDWHCPSASNDLQVGGRYIARMEARDGSFGFDLEAIYQTITPGNAFTHIMTDGRSVSVDMLASESQTEVVVSFEAEDQHPLEIQRAGWQAILDNFKRYTEQH